MGLNTKLLCAALLDHEPRPTPTERLVERTTIEPRLWVIFAVVALVSVVGHPGSLPITVPVGIYLFWCRQRATRIRTQVQHDELAARADRADNLHPGGRHAR